MTKSLLEIYGLAVCFFTVACLVIVGGMALWRIVQVAAPNLTLHSILWERHQSDQAYKEFLLESHRWDKDHEGDVAPEGAALTEARERSYVQALRSHRRDAFQELAQNILILLVDAVVFLIHWKVAARARQSAS